MDEIEDVRQQIDHRLVELKVKAALSESVDRIERSCILGIETCYKPWFDASIQMWTEGMDGWAGTVYRIYEEVWKIQRKAKTPQFIRITCRKGVIPSIKLYQREMRRSLNKYVRLWAGADAVMMEGVLATAKAAADRCRREWLVKCEIKAHELTYRQEELGNAEAPNAALAADDEIPGSMSNGRKPPPQPARAPGSFDPGRYGGKEIAIVVSYRKDGRRDMRKLSQILADKAHLQYQSSQYSDPKSWFRNDPPGFRNHIYRLRKKAAGKGWTNAIPADYWRRYR